MNIEELKQRCLKESDTHRQLEHADRIAGNVVAESYNRGVKEAWLEVHQLLVIYFPEKQEKGLVVNDG